MLLIRASSRPDLEYPQYIPTVGVNEADGTAREFASKGRSQAPGPHWEICGPHTWGGSVLATHSNPGGGSAYLSGGAEAHIKRIQWPESTGSVFRGTVSVGVCLDTCRFCTLFRRSQALQFDPVSVQRRAALDRVPKAHSSHVQGGLWLDSFRISPSSFSQSGYT